jgi:hypothetical protein
MSSRRTVTEHRTRTSISVQGGLPKRGACACRHDRPPFVDEYYQAILQAAGSRLFLEYEAVLTSGESLTVVVLDRSPDGSVPPVRGRMSPLGAVLSLAAHLRQALSKQLSESIFFDLNARRPAKHALAIGLT